VQDLEEENAEFDHMNETKDFFKEIKTDQADKHADLDPIKVNKFKKTYKS
jgi:hypothetical protein